MSPADSQDYRDPSSVGLRQYNSAAGALIGLAIGDSIASGKDGSGSSQTQLSLVVGASLIRVWIRFAVNGKQPDLPSFTASRIRRWAGRQGLRPQVADDFQPISDWLERQPSMRKTTIVGEAITQALSAEKFPERGSSGSWGAACLPLAVPVGVVPKTPNESMARSIMASSIARLTHDHPVATTSAGVLAVLLGEISAGLSLEEAVSRTTTDLKGARSQFPETDPAVAQELGSKIQQGVDRSRGAGQYDEAGQLGGWDGSKADEALVVSIWAALRSNELEECVQRAQTGTKERYATAAISASIWGASRAAEATRHEQPGIFPGPLLATDVFEFEQLRRTRLAPTAETVASDLCRIFANPGGITESDVAKWPGW